MIKTFSDILGEFSKVERQRLDAEPVKHRPTIGAMYEGLSQKLLSHALPIDGLSVSAGFIRDAAGRMSDELDCILGMGEGEEVPYTGKRTYFVDDAIAVLQVKKKLNKNHIPEGFENLRSLLDLDPPKGQNVFRTADRSFRVITQRPIPENLSVLDPLQEQIYHSLVVEAARPVRILLGYHGHRTERGLRKSLLDHLETIAGIDGWFPHSFPGFIIGPDACAVKNTAMPYGYPISGEWWPLFMTHGGMAPVFTLLEAIWTRLNHMGLIDASAFGEDLELSGWNKLFDARLVGTQWQMRPAPLGNKKSLAAGPPIEWQPAFVSHEAHEFMDHFAAKRRQPLDLRELPDDEKTRARVVELEQAGIVARTIEDPSLLRCLLDQAVGICLPDGRCAIGENITGRMARWLEKHYAPVDAEGDAMKDEAEAAHPADTVLTPDGSPPTPHEHRDPTAASGP